jgi:hypothetical protein
MIIDFHTHVFPPEIREGPHRRFRGEPAFQSLYDSPQARLAGASDLLAAMDEDGIDRSIIFGFPWEDPENYRRHNDYVIDAVTRHPARLIGFCAFSPLSPEGSKEAERCLSAGLRGVGELAVYGSDLGPQATGALGEILAVCRQYDVPLLLHTNEPVGHQYPGKSPMTLRSLYDFVKGHSSSRIVLAHWGGGLFFYALMKREVPEVLKNVWFDTAASPFLYRSEVYRVAGEILGLDRILFGSDYPLIRPRRYLKEMAVAGLSEGDQAKITGLNAVSLLKLKQGA